MTDLTGRTALVTGAAGGMGADYARELAARGASLILVDCRAETLFQLAEDLRGKYGVLIKAIPADLSDEGACLSLYDEARKLGWTIDFLINNAGLGVFGSFTGSEWPRVKQLLDVNIGALTRLTHLFLPQMVERRSGRVLLVASIAAFQPTPGYAVYAAAKAYVLSFGSAIHRELRATGVTCTTICPGITDTPFFDAARQKKVLFHRLTEMKSETVVHQAIEAMLAGKATVVPGPVNVTIALITRFTPRGLLTLVAGRLMAN